SHFLYFVYEYVHTHDLHSFLTRRSSDLHKLSKADLVWFLKSIYVSRKTDDAEITMKKQNKAFFQISGAGHEGILSAAAKVLRPRDRKSTRLNSSHVKISYAVFCLKKKKY